MRALVRGATNDERTNILLDTCAKNSAISESFAKKLRLRCIESNDKRINVQGIAESKVVTSSRAIVKVTLGWEVVYEFEVWIMPHHAGVDLILGTDFMIPAVIRLDLYNATAKLPDEIVVPLLKSARVDDPPDYGNEVVNGPEEAFDVDGRRFNEFKLQRKQPDEMTHVMWVRRLPSLLPTVVFNGKGRATKVRLTNISSRTASCPTHFPVVTWILVETLPRNEGYVRVN